MTANNFNINLDQLLTLLASADHDFFKTVAKAKEGDIVLCSADQNFSLTCDDLVLGVVKCSKRTKLIGTRHAHHPDGAWGDYYVQPWTQQKKTPASSLASKYYLILAHIILQPPTVSSHRSGRLVVTKRSAAFAVDGKPFGRRAVGGHPTILGAG